jgi:chloride channel 3/4/5
MTIYLSSSESVYSTKDETAPAPTQSAANDSPSPRPTYGAFESHGSDRPSGAPESPSIVVPARRRKVMYFAAGSGIPEIKTILSGKRQRKILNPTSFD